MGESPRTKQIGFSETVSSGIFHRAFVQGLRSGHEQGQVDYKCLLDSTDQDQQPDRSLHSLRGCFGQKRQIQTSIQDSHQWHSAAYQCATLQRHGHLRLLRQGQRRKGVRVQKGDL